MKFNINIPMDHIAPPGEFQTPDAVREMAQAIERSGASSCWTTDHPAPLADWLHNDPTGHDTLDPMTALAFVAAATTRLKLVTHVVVLPYRNPFLVAKAAATLQILSGGRLILGVGVGYQTGEFEALGVPAAKRGALMDEALETIRLAWAGGPVVKQGMFFNATGNEPRPVPSPPPPIWVGGGSAKAVERAARWGDGWVPFFSPPTNDPKVTESSVTSIEDLAGKIIRLNEQRAALGRTGPVDVAIGVPSRLREFDTTEAEKFLAKAARLKEIGVTWATVELPAPNRAVFFEKLAWFGEEIIAHFPV